MLRKIGVAAALLVATMLTACGGGSTTSNNVTGSWTATLSSSTGQTDFVFKIDLTQTSNGTVSGTNLVATSGAPCFESVASAMGQFSLNSTFRGVAASTLSMTVLASEPGESSFNTLTLQGAVNGGTISGAWTMDGPAAGCTASGNFTMAKS